MTEQEAISRLHKLKQLPYMKVGEETQAPVIERCENNWAIGMAIYALDKQIPKQCVRNVEIPISTSTLLSCWECPSCTEPLVTLTPYCSQCGHALR